MERTAPAMGAAVGYGPDMLIDEGRPPQGDSGVELGVTDEDEDELRVIEERTDQLTNGRRKGKADGNALGECVVGPA